MLRDLTIENYRLFRRFTLDSIARVNLIVGVNNCGKSSLLEAIYLLTGKGNPSRLLDILSERGEFVSRSLEPRYEKRISGGYQIAHIFHGHHLDIGHAVRIQSQSERPVSLTISFGEIRQPSLFEKLEEDLGSESRSWILVIRYTQDGIEPVKESLGVLEDGLLAYPPRPHRRKLTTPEQRVRLVTTSYLGYDELAGLWDNITLTPKEDKVVEALQILEPHVERISFTSRQTSNSGILLKLKDELEPIPLGSTGDGMRRVLALTASLVSVEGGTLLVDEIDTGLHYETLTDMWRLVLETSGKRNAQVFATTHSWDCVRSFQEALSEVSDDDLGCLIRLEQRDDHIQPVSYSRDELAVAKQQDIEVR